MSGGSGHTCPCEEQVAPVSLFAWRRTLKLGKLYGVGIGPGDPRYLTLRAAELLQSADVIFTVISQNVSASTSQAVVASQKPRGAIRQLVFSMSRDRAVRQAQVQANADAIMEELIRGHDCVFATLGDAMTYSTFGYVLAILKGALPTLDVEIVPGITSFATFAARTGRVLVENRESLHVIPSFTDDVAQGLEFPPHSTTILLKTYRSREALLERLRREDNISVLYGEHLSMDDEFFTNDFDAIAARPETYLSLVMVKKK